MGLDHNHLPYVLSGKLNVNYLILLHSNATSSSVLAAFSAAWVLPIQLHLRIIMNPRPAATADLESLSLLEIVGRIVTSVCQEALRVAARRDHAIHEIF